MVADPTATPVTVEPLMLAIAASVVDHTPPAVRSFNTTVDPIQSADALPVSTVMGATAGGEPVVTTTGAEAAETPQLLDAVAV